MSRRDVTLARDTSNKKIGGVCSGLARYFDVDPVLVRVLFVATAVFGGGSILAYVLLWWFVDPATDGAPTEQSVEAFPPPVSTIDTDRTVGVTQEQQAA